MRRDLPVVLTIAGSDPSGGAGVQADLKTFVEHGVYGTSVITAVTVQNTTAITRIEMMAPDLLRAQLESVLADVPPLAIKLGMIGTAAHATVVADVFDALQPRPPIVLDPIMVATSGAPLVHYGAIAVLKHRLMPHAALATPNLAEAAMLSGAPPHDRAGLLAWAANAPCAVLLTGGDVEGTIVTDTLVYGRQMRDFTGPRVQGGPFHGTGCTLSSAIAARLAIGESLGPAVEGAIAYTRRLVAEAANRSVGRGARPLPHGYRTPS